MKLKVIYKSSKFWTFLIFRKEIRTYEYNIDKIKKLWYSKDKEYEFLAILDFDKEELEKVGNGDKYMTEFKKKIESLNDSREYKEFLSAEEDARKRYNTFKEIGRRERNIEIVKNMLKKKMDIKDISEITGLTFDEIKLLEKKWHYFDVSFFILFLVVIWRYI